MVEALPRRVVPNAYREAREGEIVNDTVQHPCHSTAVKLVVRLRQSFCNVGQWVILSEECLRQVANEHGKPHIVLPASFPHIRVQIVDQCYAWYKPTLKIAVNHLSCCTERRRDSPK